MDTSGSLLKQEINKTLESLHDFAKWKLIVASALAATAFGLSGSSESFSPWLFVFVPYACTYVDLNSYQYLLRIYLLSKVLRSRSDEDPLLNEYEKECEKYRKKGIFSFGLIAQVICSVIFSIVLLVFALMRVSIDQTKPLILIALLVTWSVGLILIIISYMVFNRKVKLLQD